MNWTGAVQAQSEPLTLDALSRTMNAFAARPKAPDYLIENEAGQITVVRLPCRMPAKARDFPLRSMVLTSQATYDRIRAECAPRFGASDIVTGQPLYLVDPGTASEFLQALRVEIAEHTARSFILPAAYGRNL